MVILTATHGYGITNPAFLLGESISSQSVGSVFWVVQGVIYTTQHRE